MVEFDVSFQSRSSSISTTTSTTTMMRTPNADPGWPSCDLIRPRHRPVEIGLTGEDCPAFEGVFEFCSISAGGSIGK